MDNFHLTLKFLGEIDMKNSIAISNELKLIAEHTGEFSLKINELGNFKGNGCYRVLWLGFGGQIEYLLSLQNKVEDAVFKLGFEKEQRRFSPHITIGQDVVFSDGFESVKSCIEIKQLPEIRVDRLCLYKSEQIGSKRVYTAISEAKLQI